MLISMSKRLQVLVEPREYLVFKKTARILGLSLGEWVRQALRKSTESIPTKDPSQKLRAIRKASEYQFPSGDIEKILAEVEEGYLS